MRSSARRRRVPAPLVLATASAMVSIGVVAFLLAERPTRTETDAMRVDASTPERAAEAFLDAWRKRDHATALALSAGPARRAVLARRDRDRKVTAAEAAVKAQVWDRMAASRLALRLGESDDLDGGRIALRGVAEGTFLDRPYRREVSFVLRPDGKRWLVEQMHLGRILSTEPAILDIDRDPADGGGHP